MRKKICFVVAVPGSANVFLRDHIAKLSETFDVYLAGNIKNKDEVNGLRIKGFQHIDIERKISIANDLKAVLQLRKYFKLMKFEAIHSVTPKAGLVCAIAGWMAGIKHRIHIFTGQVWATRTGIMRFLLKLIDWLIAHLDNHILVDGNSQKKYLVDNAIFKENKACVLGEGSICGVNTDKFNPNRETRNKIRTEIGISEEKVVFVFMGRLNKDKGINELLQAFNLLTTSTTNVFLLLFGNDEENIAATFKNYPNIGADNFLYYGRTSEPQNMLQAGDVFVLPTYREGFGSSVIEASCLGLPVITSNAYGVLDASVNGETGLQCNVGDVETLLNAMKVLAADKELRKKMGCNGRNRVLKKFKGSAVVSAWNEYYINLLK